MKAKIFIPVMLILILSLSTAYSVDFGGSIYSSSTGDFENSFNDFGFSENLKATLWLKTPFDQQQMTYLAIEGGYSLTLDISDATSFTHNADLSLFKLGMVIPLGSDINFKCDLGRLPVFDLSGVYLSQTADGMQISAASSLFSAGLFAGYTGWQNAFSSSYFLSKDLTTFTYDQASIYPFAPGFLLTTLTGSYSGLLDGHTLVAEMSGCWDFTGSEFNRMFLTAGINGGILKNLYYIFSTTFESTSTGGTIDEGIANLSKAEISFYPGFWSSSLTASAVFATASANGFAAFIPINDLSLSVTGNTPTSGLLKPGILMTMQPSRKFLITASGDLLYELDKADNPFYLDGFQWSFNFRWQLYTDLLLTLGSSQFIPGPDSQSEDFFSASLKASLSF